MGEDFKEAESEDLLRLVASMSAREQADLLRLLKSQQGSAQAVLGGAAATGNGIAVGQAHEFHLYMNGQPQPSVDPEQAYLTRVLRETDDLPLEGVDPEAKANPNLRVRLRAVYTGLTINWYRPAAETKDGHQEVRGPASRQISALGALSREKRLVLLGQPGGGKSTFVNFVTHCLAGELLGDPEANLATLRSSLPNEDGSDGDKPQPYDFSSPLLPLRIVLRDFAASKLVKGEAEDLWHYLQQKLAKAIASDQEAMLKARLLEGKVLVLLDGLDEVPEPQKLRKKLVASICDFERSFSKCRYLVTSRVDPYRNQGWELPGFHVAELAPFADGQIRSFLRRWYDNAAAVRPNRFQELPAVRAAWLERAIFRTKNLRELAGRPLLVTLMAAVHAWRGRLPDDRQQLYEEMVELLLERWEDRFERGEDSRRLLGQPELEELAGCSKQQLRHTLEAVAYQVHAGQKQLEGTADIPADILLAALLRAGRAGNPAALLEYLKERAGLLIEREDGVFCFPHRSFQEYLSACHLLDQRPRPIEELVPDDVDRWREVLLLAAAKKSTTSRAEVWDLVARFCPAPASTAFGDSSSEWRALLAGQIISECFLSKGPIENVTNRDSVLLACVKDWQVAILNSEVLPPMERHRAGIILGDLGDPRFNLEFCYLPGEENLGFVQIPPGDFIMGSDRVSDRLTGNDEKPQRKVCLKEFWIGRYPVTTAQFSIFLQDAEVKNETWEDRAPPHTPAVMISAWEAQAYCRWLQTRLRELARQSEAKAILSLIEAGWRVMLPSEELWEKAARGTYASIYPWRGPFGYNCCNNWFSGIGEPSVVGIFPRGQSCFGLEDVSGNVWESTSSFWSAQPGEMIPASRKNVKSANVVVRGGAFDSDYRDTRCASRGYLPLHERSMAVGFRIALVPPALYRPLKDSSAKK